MTAQTITLFGDISDERFGEWIVHRAQRLGLRGWVGQAQQGSITITVGGEPDMIDAMEVACSLGPASVFVDRVEREICDLVSLPHGFHIHSNE